MAIKNTAALTAAINASLTDAAPANSIDPSEVAALLVDITDSRGVVSVELAAGQITLTRANGTTVVFAVGNARPANAQYYALITNTSSVPDATAMTTGALHRESNDGAIAGWPGRTTNGWLWFWASHTLSDIRNGSGSQNQFDAFRAPTRLTIGSVSGYLYRSNEILYPAALTENWRVS